jgi:hypothetical protein
MLGELVSVGSSLAGSALGASQANRSYKLQKEALRHQEYMDKNGVQVRMQDLAAAGINPVLAGGSAADGSASMAGSSIGGGAELANAGSKAAEMMRAKKESSMFDSQVALNEAGSAKNVAESVEAEARAEVARETARNIRLSRPAVVSQTARDVAVAENQAASEKTLWGRYVRPYLSDAQEVSGVVGAVTGISRAGSAAKVAAAAAEGAKRPINHYH